MKIINYIKKYKVSKYWKEVGYSQMHYMSYKKNHKNIIKN